MSFSNQTPNYGLPQWVGTDRPTFTTDFNNAFAKIDEILNSKDTTVEALKANFENYVNSTIENDKDWNDLETGNYFASINLDYNKVHRPTTTMGYLYVFASTAFKYQYFVTVNNSAPVIYFRYKSESSTSWSVWFTIVTESDLKKALSDINNQFETLNISIGNLENENKELTTKVENLEKNKMIQISFAPYSADGNYKIPANSSKNFSLAIRSEGYTSIPSTWHCIGITELLAGLGTTFTIHGADVATKWNDDNTALTQRLSVTFRNDSDKEQTISSTNAVIEAIFMTNRSMIEVPAIKADYR